MGLFDLIIDVATAPVKVVLGATEAGLEAVKDILEDLE